MRGKRSQRVDLTLVTALAAALTAGAAGACDGGHGRLTAADPCAPETFDDGACQSAVRDHGYYYGGHWVPHIYPRPFGWYLHSSSLYTHMGGVHRSFASSSGASHSAAGRSAGGEHGVSRGGFGSHGAAHGSGGA